MSAHAWLHRRGVARVVNTTTSSYSDACTAMIDTAGPRWLGARLWRFALLKDNFSPAVDQDSLRVIDVWHLSDGRYRWKIAFRRFL